MDILTEEDRSSIEQALELAKSLRQELLKARRAGIDTTALQERLDEAERNLKNIKRVYFSTS